MNMNQEWLKVKKMNEGIFAIDDNGSDTIYLVSGDKYSLLIDTGWGIGDLKGMIAELTDLPLIVINTHGHPDHVIGDYHFPDIHIAAKDIPVLTWSFRERRKWSLEHLLKGPYPEHFDKDEWLGARTNNIIPIQDKHMFDLGNRKIEVITIPGHSPGSIALLDEKNGMLFSGDSIMEGNIWMQLDHSTPLDVYLSSLKKLNRKIDSFDTIYPAHGRTPLQTNIINELINGITEIMNGGSEGSKYESFAGNGLLCRFQTCGIVYDDKKLTASL